VSRYRFIAAEKATYPVAILCRTLGVSRCSFYAWLERGPSAREQTDQQLLGQISKIHRTSRGTYGAPRVHAELRDDYGVRVGRKRVARLMRAHGLVGCHRRRRRGLTRPDPAATPAPDLVGRLFDPGAPDRTWFADISYIPTEQGWLYLAAVLDGCSRRVVGWAMADHLRAELALDALQMALERRQPPRGLICHSDRGSQYTAGVYTQALEAAGLRQSMGRVATCFDNAACESFFATLKTELVHTRTWPTRQAARTAIYEYIEVFYNRRRRHSALNYLSPTDYERRHHQQHPATLVAA
jgi:transposase InsO family protein